MSTNDKDLARDIWRDAILEAMDDAARRIFGDSAKRNDAGASDDDLPRLFPVLDAQLDVLAARYNHKLSDGYYVEFNGDLYQSVFPAHEAVKSQLHLTTDDALSYMRNECGVTDNIEVIA